MRWIYTVLSFSFCSLVAGCATITPEASKLMTIQDGAVMAMMDCEKLGYVSGNGGIWGGSAGLDSAYIDAKNKAVKYAGANAILITNSRENPTGLVNATVYNCSERKTQRIEVVNQHPSGSPKINHKSDNEIFRKAEACQKQGGVWINDQCVLDIK